MVGQELYKRQRTGGLECWSEGVTEGWKGREGVVELGGTGGIE